MGTWSWTRFRRCMCGSRRTTRSTTSRSTTSTPRCWSTSSTNRSSAEAPPAATAYRSATIVRPAALRVYGDDATVEGLAGRARFEWDSLDAWFEEDEQVFVHPRDPYTRVDALRSTRSVRIELDGVILAESSSPVLVFETGLPTRYYLNRTEVDFTHLVPTDSVTACPYKGTTSGYWTAQLGDTSYSDIAWVYDFPTRQLLPIAGMIAFYDEKVDTFLDGRLLDRPVTQPSLLREDGRTRHRGS